VNRREDAGMASEWDCVVVGGGGAGLSAALVLGRARQRTLLLDGGRQSNRVAAGIGGLLGSDRRPPAEFYAAGRAELAAYPSVEIRDVEALDGAAADPGFVLTLANGGEERARTVLLATGMDYRFTELPGARERWGHSVFHCPFCHGWEVRDRALAVLGDDEAALHRALMLRSWSESVTLLSDGPSEQPAEARKRLSQAGVEIDERPLAELRGEGRELSEIVFADGSSQRCGGLLVPIQLEAARRCRSGSAPAAPSRTCWAATGSRSTRCRTPGHPGSTRPGTWCRKLPPWRRRSPPALWPRPPSSTLSRTSLGLARRLRLARHLEVEDRHHRCDRFALVFVEAVGGFVLDRVGALEDVDEEGAEVLEALLVEDEGRAGQVRFGAVLDRSLDQGAGGVGADRLEDHAADPLAGRGGDLRPILVAEEGALGGAIEVLDRAAARLGFDQFDAVVFEQCFDVVADVAERFAEFLGELVRARDAAVERGQDLHPQRMRERFRQLLGDSLG
jgi:thioredoxin reductase